MKHDEYTTLIESDKGTIGICSRFAFPWCSARVITWRDVDYEAWAVLFAFIAATLYFVLDLLYVYTEHVSDTLANALYIVCPIFFVFSAVGYQIAFSLAEEEEEDSEDAHQHGRNKEPSGRFCCYDTEWLAAVTNTMASILLTVSAVAGLSDFAGYTEDLAYAARYTGTWATVIWFFSSFLYLRVWRDYRREELAKSDRSSVWTLAVCTDRDFWACILDFFACSILMGAMAYGVIKIGGIKGAQDSVDVSNTTVPDQLSFGQPPLWNWNASMAHCTGSACDGSVVAPEDFWRAPSGVQPFCSPPHITEACCRSTHAPSNLYTDACRCVLDRLDPRCDGFNRIVHQQCWDATNIRTCEEELEEEYRKRLKQRLQKDARTRFSQETRVEVRRYAILSDFVWVIAASVAAYAWYRDRIEEEAGDEREMELKPAEMEFRA